MLKTTSVAFAAFIAGSMAQAATISVSTFSYADWNSKVGASAVIEDFENPSALSGTFENGNALTGTSTTEGELLGSISTAVGTFTSLGPIGSGTTCGTFDLNGDGCHQLALQQDPGQNGQGNIVPDNGLWSLNSNDTQGMEWVADLGGALFKSVVFAIQDAADAGQKILSITAGGQTQTFNALPNNNEQLVFIDFGADVSSATINIRTSANDGFTIDGAAINVVPLPASSLLLIGGIAALGGVARRRKAKQTA